MKQYRSHYRFLLTFCFNIGLFYLLYLWLQRNIHLHSLLSDIEQINLFSLFFIFIFYFFILIIYGSRLSLLLKADFRKSFYLIGIGNGLNNLLPFRLGDILRVYFAKRFYDIDMPRAAAATFMERYFDLIILLIFGSFILLNKQYGMEMNAIYLFLILFTCSVLSIILYRYLIVKDSFLKQMICRSAKAQSLLQAVEEVVSTPNKLRVFFSTFIIWCCVLAVYYLFFIINLPTPAAFSFGGAIFLLFTTTLSFAIPYAFAGIGIFEAAVVYYLTNYLHVIPTKALALAIVFHLVMAVPQITLLLGIVVLHRLRRFMRRFRFISLSPYDELKD